MVSTGASFWQNGSYGATAAGGSTQQGVVFKVKSQGTVTVVHNFTGKESYWQYCQ